MTLAARLRMNARLLSVAAIAVLAVVWIASGVVLREAPQAPEVRERSPISVAVEHRTAQPVEQILSLQGQVEPHMRVQVRAETAGQVAEWFRPLGVAVAQGERLARLRMDDREARRKQAIASLRDTESELEATRRLVERGAAARIQLDAREAAVAAARAEVGAIELEIENTNIRSPVEGVIHQRIAERGDFVGVGDAVAEIIDNDPLLGVANVAQHQISRVEPGQRARLRFLDGRRAEGEVTFVSSVAQPGTRTFRVEIEVPNPQGALPSGISAGIEIPTREVEAHKVSPAVISLDDAGQIGVKTVTDDNRVEVHTIEVIRTAPDGVWITGLPREIRLITVGQGFVSAGEPVRAQEVEGGDTLSSAEGERTQ